MLPSPVMRTVTEKIEEPPTTEDGGKIRRELSASCGVGSRDEVVGSEEADSDERRSVG